MLPTINGDNAANLNAAFITDNSLELAEGNFEAETNKPYNNSGNSSDNKMENYNISNAEVLTQTTNDGSDNVAAATVIDATDVADAAVEVVDVTHSSFVENERLTIENNEEAELNDNINESLSLSSSSSSQSQSQSQDGGVEDLPEHLSEFDLSAAAATEDVEAALEAETATETETVAVDSDGDINEYAPAATIANTDADFDSHADVEHATEMGGYKEDIAVNDAHHLQLNENLAIESNVGNGELHAAKLSNAGIHSSAKYSNYAAKKQREDVSSSDDDSEIEEFEMNPEFNSEWANLAEDLANANDDNNDLNNDIDVYESVPIDLSNDIAVNDVAAAQGYPINPDAEFIYDAVEHDSSGGSGSITMPRFEKLSLASDANHTTTHRLDMK